jgi:hypothetical protein
MTVTTDINKMISLTKNLARVFALDSKQLPDSGFLESNRVNVGPVN